MEQPVLGNPEIRKLFTQAVAEGFRQVVDSNLVEAIMLVRPWGFYLNSLGCGVAAVTWLASTLLSVGVLVTLNESGGYDEAADERCADLA